MDKKSKKFITYKDKTLTFYDFEKKVKYIQRKFDNFKDINDFVLIKEKNPLNFYILLYALWNLNKKIVFPNKDCFEGKIFDFVKYVVNVDSISKNNKFVNISLPNNCDTILFSSGSTGQPKGILHRKDNFFNNANSVSKIIDKKNLTTVTPLKPYLISALSHFLIHKLTQSHLIFVDIDAISSISHISEKYDNLSCAGSPMHIILMLPFIQNKNPEIFFSSGDIFYTAIIKNILDKFPKTIFFNVYGMAELGGRMFINKVDQENSKQIKSIGNNISGTNIKIENDGVFVKSDFLFDGYIIDNKFIKRNNDYFKTNDKVIKINEHYEFFGRADEEIKIAGNKVSLKYIEQKISEVLSKDHTPIVVSQNHKLFGNIVVLVLFAKQNKPFIKRKNLINSLKEVLKTYEIPHKIYLTNKIPYTQTMKINRKKIVDIIDNLELLV